MFSVSDGRAANQAFAGLHLQATEPIESHQTVPAPVGPPDAKTPVLEGTLKLHRHGAARAAGKLPFAFRPIAQ